MGIESIFVVLKMEFVLVVNWWKDIYSNESMDILFFKRLICYNLVYVFIFNKK